MAKLLLKKNYLVYGTSRSLKSDAKKFWRLKELNILSHKNLIILRTELDSYQSVKKLLNKIHPDEIYNFASQNFSAEVNTDPFNTIKINAFTLTYFLEAIRTLKIKTRFFQASSIQILNPTSAYSSSKLFGANLIKIYREQYGIFAAQAILYNHESELRDERFVTRKITFSVAKIKVGKAKELILNNLDSKRDWAYAPEFIAYIYKILHRKEAADYILNTGKEHTVGDLVNLSFKFAGLDSSKYVKLNKTGFKNMIKKMVKKDMDREMKK